MKFVIKHIWLFIFIAVVFAFSSPFILQGKVPIPADTLVGLYHPWRDSKANQYPNGIPVKNFLITDPVRQQYPFRMLAIEQLKNGKWPSWNPYSFSGTPLLANIQSAVFYPLNILFWFTNFSTAWSILVLLQPLLAGIFMYLYLNEMRLDKRASLMGALAFAFSGFIVAWLEWNTIGHVALWLPLILLAKEKLIKSFSIKWGVVLIAAESTAFFAGYLQTWMYIVGFTTVYLIVRILQPLHSSPLSKGRLGGVLRGGIPSLWEREGQGELLWKFVPFFITGSIMLLVTCIQWVRAFDFITLSARTFDLPNWHRMDWFIPWQHLLQFVSPDFFGNPATGNYWGVWNYGEFVGYIGLVPLFFALYGLISRRDKKTLYFGVGLLVALILGLPTFIAAMPYQLNIPFLSTLQPSRIMVIIDFSLAVLAAFGFDYFLKKIPHLKLSLKEPMVRLLEILVLLFVSIWLVLLFGRNLGLSGNFLNYLEVAKRNMVLPTIILSSLVIYLFLNLWKRNKQLLLVTTLLLLLLTSYDLVRFSSKFNTFSDISLLYPQTKTIEFLQKNLGSYRYMTTDRRLIPPNVGMYYKLQSVEGYDPLYLQKYGELMAAWTRNRPDISPASFNRILIPENHDSFFSDLLGVKYIVSLTDQVSSKLKLVFQEGETRVYENTNVLPRVFLVEEIKQAADNKSVMQELFANQKNLTKVAFTDQNLFVKPDPLFATESAKLTEYSENRVMVMTKTNQERLLVLTDVFYPDWKVFINGHESSIFPVDYTLRGVVVPKGESTVEFKI